MKNLAPEGAKPGGYLILVGVKGFAVPFSSFYGVARE